MSEGWDRDTALRELSQRHLDGSNLIIAKMWVYHRDLEKQAWIYSDAKTEFGRRYARVLIAARMEGEKSADAAGKIADMDPDVHKAHLAYRLAEQMVAANKEALKILHAELEAFRTKAADARAADSFLARTQT